MFSKTILSVAVLAFASAANAHFQMQFPVPRGPFVEDSEPNFCDDYTNAVDNRTTFPLDNGFISLNSEHPKWTAGVLISIEQDPTNFTVFNTSTTGVKLPLAVQFFQTTGEGVACIPLDIGSLGIPGVGDGSNVTIQVEFNGGDGNLFQCADLTLSKSVSIPSNVSCTHIVANSTSNFTATSTSSSATSTSTSPSTTTSSGAERLVVDATGLLGMIAVAFFSFF